MAQDYIRQTAYPCQISDIINGEYVKKEGWESNVVKTCRGDVSRVNIIAAVVGKEEQQIELDDGSGRIVARTFDDESVLVPIRIGDVVQVVGKVREYNASVYVLIEIVKAVNPAWAVFRKKALEQVFVARVEPKKTTVTTIVTPVSKNPKEAIITRIRSLDTGTGVRKDELKKYVSDIDGVLDELLREGEIFEVQPDVVKVLDS